jgi:hypothetical protein
MIKDIIVFLMVLCRMTAEVSAPITKNPVTSTQYQVQNVQLLVNQTFLSVPKDNFL